MNIESSENKHKVAIVVVGYDRLLSIKRLLSSLEKAVYPSDDVPLVISIDASGNQELYDYAESYKWFHGDKYTIIRKERMGLKNHIFACGDLTQYFEAIILLEDDLYVSPYFYEYVLSTVDYYSHEPAAACIGLYSYTSNIYAALPFMPFQTEYDVYGIQATITWGECWNRRMWHDFKEWLNHNDEIDWKALDIPDNVKNFKRAWSKFFTAYLSVTDRYVIAPYKSYTTNFSEAGEHRNSQDSCVQVPYVRRREELKYGPIDKIVKYDSFFNPVGMDAYLSLPKEDLFVDLYSLRPNNRNCRYLLTTDILPYKCLRSFALVEKPIEANIVDNIPGVGIYLYDLSERDTKGSRDINTLQSIEYRLQMFRPQLLKKYLLNFIMNHLKNKFKRLFK